MKLLLSVSACSISLFGVFATKAQQTSISDVIVQPKWEIGTDLLWLIDKNTLPKYTLLLRYNICKCGAIRLRSGFANNSFYDSWRQIHRNQYRFIRLGYEYQHIVHRHNSAVKSLIYAGMDYLYRYEYDAFEDYSPTMLNQGGGTHVETKTNESGGVIFIGLKYFLTRNISMSTETSFQVTKVKYNQNETALNFAYHSDTDFIPRWSYQTLPISTINLSFHF